jgi:hypothetical protein
MKEPVRGIQRNLKDCGATALSGGRHMRHPVKAETKLHISLLLRPTQETQVASGSLLHSMVSLVADRCSSLENFECGGQASP